MIRGTVDCGKRVVFWISFSLFCFCTSTCWYKNRTRNPKRKSEDDVVFGIYFENYFDNYPDNYPCTMYHAPFYNVVHNAGIILKIISNIILKEIPKRTRFPQSAILQGRGRTIYVSSYYCICVFMPRPQSAILQGRGRIVTSLPSELGALIN